MITAEILKKGAWLAADHVEDLLRKTYPQDIVLGCVFLGVTTGGQFCYEISYPAPETKKGVARSKVYVWRDNNGELLADY